MKSEILNKRKKWLDSETARKLGQWTSKADKLDGETGSITYFGIEQREEGFEINPHDSKKYFQQSLALFKTVLNKQVSNEDTGLPSLHQPPQYDALISIVGFSPEPLLHTILALAPIKVYPIATDESALYYKVDMNAETQKRDGQIQYFEAIIQEYKDSVHNISVEPIGRNVASIGALDTFRRVTEIIKTVRNNNKEAKISLDITGGKKSADVAAFLVGAIDNDVDIYYVDFEEYEKGKPKCGTEFLNKLDNPYDIYNIQLLSHAKALFENHRYDVAYDVFSQIEKKMNPKGKEGASLYGLEDEWHAIRNMRDAAECYMKWDKYSFKEAYASSRCLNDRQKDELWILQEYEDCPDKKSRYASPLLYHFVLDRFLSAQRRWHESRYIKGEKRKDVHVGYHDAMLRYFQCIEVMIDAYITINQTEKKYDPDNKSSDSKRFKYLLSMEEKRNLCFKGKEIKKYKGIDHGVVFELKKPISNHDLKGEITWLNDRRDVFVHVNLANQKDDVKRADVLVKKLMKEVFDKTLQKLDDDIGALTFKRSFDEKGNMI